jgi:hypothetical protein
MPRLVDCISGAAIERATLQFAQQRILPAELGQPALEIGIEGVDAGGLLRLIVVSMA